MHKIMRERHLEKMADEFHCHECVFYKTHIQFYFALPWYAKDFALYLQKHNYQVSINDTDIMICVTAKL